MEYEIIRTLAEIGVPKETTLDIFKEIMTNNKYAEDKDAIDVLLREKLGIDLYISLQSYFKIE